MSSSSSSPRPRVERKHRPSITLRRHTYRKALPCLLQDFDNRCAYSMQHVRCAGGQLEVDHFDPRKKDRPAQSYDNLFPATRYCNGAKSDLWPTNSQRAKGVRFLNCCEEQDYGAVIFEDPNSHELMGTTPAARYHIVTCDLNAPHLVDERRRRSQYRDLLERPAVFRADATIPEISNVIRAFTEAVSFLIPPIAAPPGNGPQ